MQNLTQRGFTLAYLDPFQPTMSLSVRESVLEGRCSRPSRATMTRIRLWTFLSRGWCL